ncbi:FdtA/QdtA family cupin domain-containing protein [Enterobacter sp. ENT03]|uniref:sugar 3,4-ketoisomerase n=1 Tax=Enterobacter sp. ENT03 TaxID=2854780 RepID=UPI001C444BC4|nr:FdtA/QdtA family cupin domain-containing protein [Enterobacter sp. ENT03]MBV7405705.1 FdtA/QdtA family cupin domain-containing protein [Enterobacter sp. ENT03]
MSLIKFIDFNILGDERGSLVAIENNKNIPFEIKRIYYIFGTKENVSRGYHAHRDLQQVAICVSGHCEFIIDDGINRESVLLNNPTKGLYIDNNKWREMHNFSEDCVLLVIASKFYDEEDYIRNYDDFLKGI